MPRISRRAILKGGAAAAGLASGTAAITGFPTIWAQNIKDIVLRHSGPPVTAIPAIAEQASKDLGFKVQMQASENADLLNRFLSQSNTMDCADISLVFMRYVIGRNVLQAIPIAKHKHWDKTMPLFTKGESSTGKKLPQQGITPLMILYATGPDGQKVTDGKPTDWVTGVPGEPHGLGGGRGAVNVVARGGGGPLARDRVHVSAAERRFPRLGFHARRHEARRRTEARSVLRVFELVHGRLPGRVHREAGLLRSATGERAQVPDAG